LVCEGIPTCWLRWLRDMNELLPGMIVASSDPMVHVAPHTVFTVWGLPFTNHMLMVSLTAMLMVIIFPLLAKNYPLVPSGFRNFFEILMEFIRVEVVRPSLHQHTDRFMPFLWTLFFFILFNNLLGLVPLDALSLVAFRRGHLFGTATAGISITAALAAAAFAVTHVSGMVEQYRHQRQHGRALPAAVGMGFLMYWYNFVPHIPGVVGVIMFPILLFLELIGAFVKPFALCIRLFANMMAGHVVLASLLVLAPAIHSAGRLAIAGSVILGCAALNLLELFVALLQAYVFVFLTSMFIGAAVSPEH